ncbi:MAG: S8 family serine peptidase [Phycisphaerales bacterium]|nr:S8 family serine peptidase [Phycisphaerales bacterium]
MPNFTRLTQATMVAAIVSISGLPSSALAGPSKSAPTNTQQQTLSSAQKLNAVKSALNLQPGDAQIMEQAIRNPLLFVEKAKSQEFTRELIVHAKKGKAPIAQARIAPSMVKASQFMDEYVVTVPTGVSEGEMAAMLMATGEYLFVEPNWRLFPTNTPNDSQFGSSWQHNRLQSTAAWDIHTGDSDIIVAICDSGVDTNHNDLEDALVPGYNAVNNAAQVDGGQVEDVNGHGTFVSGLAAAQGNNGTGVVGVGWDFRVMPIRVSNNSAGTANGFDILEGARWAVDNGAKAINASFSGGASSGNQATANYIIDNGGLFFWSSGNDNTNVSYDSPDLVLVGSTTSSDNRSGFSNYGTAVDLVAPGSSVRSTRNGGSYGNGSGTSYASPIAAGVAAMIFSVRDDLTGRDVQDVLYNSVDDLGATGRDDFYGRGRVNTLKAVQNAATYVTRPYLPISESFDSASWMDIFDVTAGAPTTVVDAESTGAGSVIRLDSNDEITTVALAGSSLPLVPGLSFNLKVSGVEAGESLQVEMIDTDGVWQTLIDYTATGVDTDGYVSVGLSLTPAFRHHSAKVRFTSDASDSSDQWLIDDLFIGELTSTPVVPFVDSFEAGVVSSTIWEESEGVSVDVQGTSHVAVMSGDSSMTTITVPMEQFGFVPAYVRFDASAASGAGADDTLLVEATDVLGNWLTLDTIDASTLGTSPETIELETTFTSWFTDFLQVRFTSAGNDPIYLDNVYVGPDQASAMCSGADFAEPFGQLNFLDVSAFLSAFGESDPSADIDGSGTFNFLDVSAFLSEYGNGCP